MEKKKVLNIAYNSLMVILGLLTFIIIILYFVGDENSKDLLNELIFTIWAVCVVDYGLRLIKAKNKKAFIKNHIIDLISIIPLASTFQMYKITRIFWATRDLAVFIRFVRFIMKFKDIVKTNGFLYVFTLNTVVIFLGAIGLYVLEDGISINGFADAIWWGFVTSTTVGYGDIFPATTGGRVIAVIVMLFGITTIGMLTSTLATYFSKNRDSKVITVPKELLERLNESAKENYRTTHDHAEYIINKYLESEDQIKMKKNNFITNEVSKHIIGDDVVNSDTNNVDNNKNNTNNVDNTPNDQN